MFLAARSFMTKLGYTVVAVVFPSLLLLGKSVGDDLDIRLTAVVAFGLSVVGFLAFLALRRGRGALGPGREGLGVTPKRTAPRSRRR